MGLPTAESSRRPPPAAPYAVIFDRVSLAFDDHVVLQDLSFTVPTGAMRILLGPSGSGKSVILKLILGLLRPDAGSVTVNGHRVDTMSEQDLLKMRADIGMTLPGECAVRFADGGGECRVSPDRRGHAGRSG